MNIFAPENNNEITANYSVNHFSYCKGYCSVTIFFSFLPSLLN